MSLEEFVSTPEAPSTPEVSFGPVAVAQAPAIPALPTYIVNVTYLNSRLGVRIAQPFTIIVSPYFGGEYTARAHFFPTTVAAHSASAAIDGLISVLVNRRVRFHIVRADLPPDLYDGYRALCAHIAFC